MARDPYKDMDTFSEDEFNFDDLDNMDGAYDGLSMDEFEEIDSDSERSPVSESRLNTRVLRGAASAAAGGAAAFLTRKISNEFPETKNLVDEGLNIASDVVRLKEEFMKDITPTVNQLKTVGRRILPRVEDAIPKNIYDKLNKALEVTDYGGKDPKQGETNDTVLANTIKEVFSAEQTLDRYRTKDAKLDSLINRQLQSSQHRELATMMNDVRTFTLHQTAFNRQISVPYMKKMLELKYQHLWASRDILDVLKLMAQTQEKKLDEIRHNTSLPDIQKEKLTEKYKDMMRDKLLGGITQYVSDFGKNVLANLKNEVLGPTKDMADMLADIGEGMATGLEMDDEMADMEGHKPQSLMGTAAMHTARYIGGLGGGAVGNKINKMLAPHKGNIELTAGNTKLNAILAMDKIKRGETDLPGGDLLASVMESLLPSLDRTAGTVKNSLFADPDEAVQFDVATRSAIVEIIPGYLAKILKQITEMNTGAPAQEMVYDASKRSFSTENEYRASVTEQLFGTKQERTITTHQGISPLRDQLTKSGTDTQVVDFDKVADEIGLVFHNLAAMKEFPIVNTNAFKEAYEANDITSNSYVTEALQGCKHPEKVLELIYLSLFDETGMVNRTTYLSWTREIQKYMVSTMENYKGKMNDYVNNFGNNRYLTNIMSDASSGNNLEVGSDKIRGIMLDTDSTLLRNNEEASRISDEVNAQAEEKRANQSTIWHNYVRRKNKSREDGTDTPSVTDTPDKAIAGKESSPLNDNAVTGGSKAASFIQKTVDRVANAIPRQQTVRDTANTWKDMAKAKTASLSERIKEVQPIEKTTQEPSKVDRKSTASILPIPKQEKTPIAPLLESMGGDRHIAVLETIANNTTIANQLLTDIASRSVTLQQKSRLLSLGKKALGAYAYVATMPLRIAGAASRSLYKTLMGRPHTKKETYYIDIYRKNEVDGKPLITAKQFEQGILNKEGKLCKDVRTIHSELYDPYQDDKGNKRNPTDATTKARMVLSMDDITQGLVDKDNSLITDSKTMSRIRAFASGTTKGAAFLAGAGLRLGFAGAKYAAKTGFAVWKAGATMAIKGASQIASGLLNPFVDIYWINDDNKLELLITGKELSKKGVDSVTKKIVESSYSITHPIIDKYTGNFIITKANIDRGLLGPDGKSLSKFGVSVGRGLRHAIGTVARVIPKIARGVFAYTKWFYNTLGKGISSVAGMLFGKSKKDPFVDVYVAGEPQPVLEGEKIRKGLYCYADGTIVKSAHDIIGPVFQVKRGKIGNCILSKEALQRGLTDVYGKVISVSAKATSKLQSAIEPVASTAKKATGWFKKKAAAAIPVGMDIAKEKAKSVRALIHSIPESKTYQKIRKIPIVGEGLSYVDKFKKGFASWKKGDKNTGAGIGGPQKYANEATVATQRIIGGTLSSLSSAMVDTSSNHKKKKSSQGTSLRTITDPETSFPLNVSNRKQRKKLKAHIEWETKLRYQVERKERNKEIIHRRKWGQDLVGNKLNDDRSWFQRMIDRFFPMFSHMGTALSYIGSGIGFVAEALASVFGLKALKDKLMGKKGHSIPDVDVDNGGKQNQKNDRASKGADGRTPARTRAGRRPMPRGRTARGADVPSGPSPSNVMGPQGTPTSGGWKDRVRNSTFGKNVNPKNIGRAGLAATAAYFGLDMYQDYAAAKDAESMGDHAKSGGSTGSMYGTGAGLAAAAVANKTVLKSKNKYIKLAATVGLPLLGSQIGKAAGFTAGYLKDLAHGELEGHDAFSRVLYNQRAALYGVPADKAEDAEMVAFIDFVDNEVTQSLHKKTPLPEFVETISAKATTVFPWLQTTGEEKDRKDFIQLWVNQRVLPIYRTLVALYIEVIQDDKSLAPVLTDIMKTTGLELNALPIELLVKTLNKLKEEDKIDLIQAIDNKLLNHSALDKVKDLQLNESSYKTYVARVLTETTTRTDKDKNVENTSSMERTAIDVASSGIHTAASVGLAGSVLKDISPSTTEKLVNMGKSVMTHAPDMMKSVAGKAAPLLKKLSPRAILGLFVVSDTMDAYAEGGAVAAAETATRGIGGIGGSLAGGAVGAAAGAKLGILIGGSLGFLLGGIGSIPGAAIGAAVGTVAGYFIGADFGGDIGEYLVAALGIDKVVGSFFKEDSGVGNYPKSKLNWGISLQRAHMYGITSKLVEPDPGTKVTRSYCNLDYLERDVFSKCSNGTTLDGKKLAEYPKQLEKNDAEMLKYLLMFDLATEEELEIYKASPNDTSFWDNFKSDETIAKNKTEDQKIRDKVNLLKKYFLLWFQYRFRLIFGSYVEIISGLKYDLNTIDSIKEEDMVTIVTAFDAAYKRMPADNKKLILNRKGFEEWYASVVKEKEHITAKQKDDQAKGIPTISTEDIEAKAIKDATRASIGDVTNVNAADMREPSVKNTLLSGYESTKDALAAAMGDTKQFFDAHTTPEAMDQYKKLLAAKSKQATALLANAMNGNVSVVDIQKTIAESFAKLKSFTGSKLEQFHAFLQEKNLVVALTKEQVFVIMGAMGAYVTKISELMKTAAQSASMDIDIKQYMVSVVETLKTTIAKGNAAVAKTLESVQSLVETAMVWFGRTTINVLSDIYVYLTKATEKTRIVILSYLNAAATFDFLPEKIDLSLLTSILEKGQPLVDFAMASKDKAQEALSGVDVKSSLDAAVKKFEDVSAQPIANLKTATKDALAGGSAAAAELYNKLPENAKTSMKDAYDKAGVIKDDYLNKYSAYAASIMDGIKEKGIPETLDANWSLIRSEVLKGVTEAAASFEELKKQGLATFDKFLRQANLIVKLSKDKVAEILLVLGALDISSVEMITKSFASNIPDIKEWMKRIPPAKFKEWYAALMRLTEDQQVIVISCLEAASKIDILPKVIDLTVLTEILSKVSKLVDIDAIARGVSSLVEPLSKDENQKIKETLTDAKSAIKAKTDAAIAASKSVGTDAVKSTNDIVNTKVDAAKKAAQNAIGVGSQQGRLPEKTPTGTQQAQVKVQAQGATGTPGAKDAKEATAPKPIASTYKPKAGARVGDAVAQFESGNGGSTTIGFDRHGGTSFGKYQFATRPGGLAAFIRHCLTLPEGQAFAQRMIAAIGPLAKSSENDKGWGNTGSKRGPSVDAWLAGAAAGELGDLEHSWMEKQMQISLNSLSKDNPAAAAMVQGNTGLTEAYWSSVVQHGPYGSSTGPGARGIFNTTFTEGITPQEWATKIYENRGKRFGSSSGQVQASVKGRFARELPIILGMMDKKEEDQSAAMTADGSGGTGADAVDSTVSATQDASSTQQAATQVANSGMGVGIVQGTKTADLSGRKSFAPEGGIGGSNSSSTTAAATSAVPSTASASGASGSAPSVSLTADGTPAITDPTKLDEGLKNVKTQTSDIDLQGLHPSMKKALAGANAEYMEKNNTALVVSSGKRTLAKQGELYRKLGPGRAAVPSPTSPHIAGIAVDIKPDSSALKAESQGILQKYGLSLPLKNGLGRTPPEPWHVELANARKGGKISQTSLAALSKEDSGVEPTDDQLAKMEPKVTPEQEAKDTAKTASDTGTALPTSTQQAAEALAPNVAAAGGSSESASGGASASSTTTDTGQPIVAAAETPTPAITPVAAPMAAAIGKEASYTPPVTIAGTAKQDVKSDPKLSEETATSSMQLEQLKMMTKLLTDISSHTSTMVGWGLPDALTGLGDSITKATANNPSSTPAVQQTSGTAPSAPKQEASGRKPQYAINGELRSRKPPVSNQSIQWA